MPTYTVTNSNFNISSKQQKKLAEGITKVHNVVTGANTYFAQVIFNKRKKNKNASLVFYDKEEKIQLRVKVECDVNNQNSTTEESWKKTQHISRRCYLTDSPPGTTSENPTSGMISKLEDFDYSMEQSEEGYKNFTVIKCKIKSIEWLYLAAKGHRRAKFDLETNKNDWLVP